MPDSATFRTLFWHSAVPMVGFGFMDNIVMIQVQWVEALRSWFSVPGAGGTAAVPSPRPRRSPKTLTPPRLTLCDPDRTAGAAFVTQEVVREIRFRDA